MDCHLNLHHGVKTEKNYCKKCENSYVDTHKCFKGVRYTQKKPEREQCVHCGKVFSSLDNMKRLEDSSSPKVIPNTSFLNTRVYF